MNSYAIRKADVKRFDLLYQAMKKRRNFVQNNTNNTFDLLDKPNQSSQGNVNNQDAFGVNGLRKLNLKRIPQSRDGHTGVVYKGMLVIFGGDRYCMPYNDTFVFNIKNEFMERGLNTNFDYWKNIYNLFILPY